MNTISRRDFLKLLGVATVAAASPVGAMPAVTSLPAINSEPENDADKPFVAFGAKACCLRFGD